MSMWCHRTLLCYWTLLVKQTLQFVFQRRACCATGNMAKRGNLKSSFGSAEIGDGNQTSKLDVVQNARTFNWCRVFAFRNCFFFAGNLNAVLSCRIRWSLLCIMLFDNDFRHRWLIHRYIVYGMSILLVNPVESYKTTVLNSIRARTLVLSKPQSCVVILIEPFTLKLVVLYILCPSLSFGTTDLGEVDVQ